MFYFRVASLPKPLYDSLRAYKARTGLTDTQITHAALAQYLGNNQAPSRVQTVQAPSTPPTDQSSPSYFTRQPGDRQSELGPDFVIRGGSTIYIGGAHAAQEPPPHREDHDRTDSQD